MKFEKTIEQIDTGMVVAEVFDTRTGGRVGIEFFTWPPFSQERRLKRAHAWADEWILNCAKYCVEGREENQDSDQVDAKGGQA